MEKISGPEKTGNTGEGSGVAVGVAIAVGVAVGVLVSAVGEGSTSG
jgi:hypothetical protein